MGCKRPLKGYRSRTPSDSGRYPIVFNPRLGDPDQPVEVPCGRCQLCRLERSRQWALRCVHESQMHENNSFITLTYRPENIPDHGTLSLDDWQRFMKRLRARVGKVRFFMCGEYGENLEHSKNGILGHPHYHACLFGYDFPDKRLYAVRDDVRLYRSDLLESLWPYGFSTIGDVTFQSAAYVARYVMKKQLGTDSELFYQYCDIETREEVFLKPEFTTMSRKPGIAKPWFDKFKDDLKKDFITMNGVKMRPPKFYDQKFEEEDYEHFEKVKGDRRVKQVELTEPDPVIRRRREDDAEKIAEKKIQKLPRSLNYES